jgi:hypothetical protein
MDVIARCPSEPRDRGRAWVARLTLEQLAPLSGAENPHLPGRAPYQTVERGASGTARLSYKLVFCLTVVLEACS